MAVANAENPENPAEENLPAPPETENVPATTEDSTELVEAEESNVIVNRFRTLSRPRQIQLIVSVAATVAMVVGIFIWSANPDYKLLYGKLSDSAAGDIIKVLEQEGIKFKLDSSTGQLKVPSDKLHSTRILLASQGLPESNESGFEMLDGSQSFGTSQFMEKARYHRAIEGELSRTISGIRGVDSARVHLAIPKQSVFIRDKRDASASVLVNLVPGKVLDEAQVSAIVHMVASGIPDLKPSKVTVVDHKGKLLSKKELNGEMAQSTAQFDFKRKMEEYYVARIERILMPIIGFEGVRAQVEADIDFTVTERTQESFNPDLPALRSEHTLSEESRGGDLGGVPGALTNQPPGVATVPEKNPNKDGGKKGSAPSKKRKQETFNYELDKTISHSRQSPGKLRRLSVAVVIDDRLRYDNEGNPVREALSPEEVERITQLVKDAVGFSVARGDSLNVTNASFQTSQRIPEEKLPPIWERQWVINLAKQVVGIILIMIIIVIALRPVIRELTFKEEPVEEVIDEEPTEEDIARQLEAEAAEREAQGGLSTEEWEELGVSYEEYEEMLRLVRELAADDPRIVAQVVKTWVALDET